MKKTLYYGAKSIKMQYWVGNVFVHPDYQGRGIGQELVNEVVRLATELYCYKLIATSRHERSQVHELYQKLGFANYGVEFRMNLE
jgi:GNAT superfamily N-acetyltransferase